MPLSSDKIEKIILIVSGVIILGVLGYSDSFFSCCSA